MHHGKSTLGRLLGAAGLASTLVFAGLSLTSLPVGAQSAPAPTTCPFLQVGNPNPGDTLAPGGYVISGVAFDPAAMASALNQSMAATPGAGSTTAAMPTNAGISRVDLFLGERDNGGTFLGSTVPGLGADPRSFSLQVQIPSLDRQTDFAAYATSAATGGVTAVTFPVFVGTSPAKVSGATPTPVPNSQVVSTTCPGGAAAVAAAAAPTLGPGSQPAIPAVLTGAAACPVLSMSNPNPGDFLTPGGLIISGIAFDPTQPSAPDAGITRVDLFLGARDQGGAFLGSGVPGASSSNPRVFSISVQVPNLNRAQDFTAYAISAVTGQETTVSFPVYVGIPPTRTAAATPTPIPTVTTISTTCA